MTKISALYPLKSKNLPLFNLCYNMSQYTLHQASGKIIKLFNLLYPDVHMAICMAAILNT